MTATYNSIPANLRNSGFYAEFDPSRANSGALQFKFLVLGQRTSTGTVAAATPVRVARSSEAEIFFGRGSQIAQMLAAVIKTRPAFDVWAIALDDLVAGQVATANLVFSGPASVAGTLRITIGDLAVRVGIASGQLANAVAGAVVAAINARTDLPATAAVDGTNASKVNLSARNKGTVGNDIPIAILFEAASQPAAPIITLTAFNGGTGNPDITDAIAALGDEWYRWLVVPWTDSANMQRLHTELTSRFSALRAIGARAFCAFRGSYGQTASYGNAHNSEHISCMGTGLSPTPPHLFAAVNACVAANSLMNDPARQLTTLVLPGVLPPALEDRFSFDERNNLAFDGISTYTVDAGGQVRIDNQLTMYQKDPQGNADDSMLHINVPELYEAYRIEQRLLFAAHARDKLCDDGNTIPTGQPIMTPKKARVLLLKLYRNLIEEKGWCEDFAGYEATLFVEKVGNRLHIVDQPNFIDNLRQMFARSELVN